MDATRWRLLAALSMVVATLALPAASAWAGPGGCAVKEGAAAPTDIPWSQKRLGFAQVQALATGAGQTVAVIDSGLTRKHPQTSKIKIRNATNVMGGGYAANDIYDCEDFGHGTRVASIIGAPVQSGVGFHGLAPEATIMPIKYRDSDTGKVAGDAAAVARGINAAVKAKVDVINLSLVAADTPALRKAVLAAGKADIVVVASSGNDDGRGVSNRFPAAYAAEDGFAHVLAVGAVDPDDQAAPFSITGPYLGVAAPGTDIVAPTQIKGYYTEDGTSFAAPYVSATAALVRQTHPDLSAQEVVNRIKATADRPGVSVPDNAYGWGILNPQLAISAERDDTRVVPEGADASPVAAPSLPPPPDHTLRNLGLVVAAGLLGVALLFAIATGAWRHTSERHHANRE